MQWLALDLGSTYAKCARLDACGGVVEARQEKTPPPLKTPPGRYEIDAEAYFRQALGLMEEMVSPDVRGVLISTQMHGWLLTDGAFCPATPYVSWQDKAALETDAQGQSFLERIRERIPPEEMRKSGVPVKANLAMCSLYARVQTGLEDIAGRRFCTLGGYVIGRLSGQHVCHVTNAGPTGLCDVQEAAWSQVRIRAAGLQTLVFPRIETDIRPVGTAVLGGVEVALFPDVGDQQVCALSAGLTPETALNVNIGTAGLIGALTPSFEPGAYENRPWIEPGLYLRSVSGLPGGRQVAVLHAFYEDVVRQLLPGEDVAQRIWDRMTQADASPTLNVRPDFFTGEGSIGGIGTDFCADDLTVSLYSAMARAYADAARGLNLPLRAARFTGGCAQKNPALRRALCAGLGMEGASDAFDVMEGMKALAQRAERALSPARD